MSFNKRSLGWLPLAALFLLIQNSYSKEIVVLPFQSIGVDEVSTQSAESIFRMELEQLDAYQVISESQTYEILGDSLCTEVGCAARIGKALGADETVSCKLATLGEKVIVQYLLVDVVEGTVLMNDRMTATTVEDLDIVLKRIAKSISEHLPVSKTAEVGLITENETREFNRREANKSAGFSFGYLYPQHGYDEDDRSFTMDFRTGFEFENLVVGSQLFLRKGFGFNLFGNYLFSKKDICPYLGTSFGFHWVSHDNDNGYYTHDNTWIEEEKKGDGFELGVNTGLQLFRTYNFQMLFSFGYTITFNDFDDQALFFTLGLLR